MSEAKVVHSKKILNLRSKVNYGAKERKLQEEIYGVIDDNNEQTDLSFTSHSRAAAASPLQPPRVPNKNKTTYNAKLELKTMTKTPSTNSRNINISSREPNTISYRKASP